MPEKLGRLGRVLPDALLLVTRGGVILDANGAAGRVFERAPASLEGERLAALVSPKHEARLDAFLRQCARSGDLIPASLDLPGSPQRLHSYRVEGAALGAAAGSPVLLRLRTRESTTNRFRLLTEKIEELGSEVSQRRRAESLLEGELQALELVVTAAPLETVLEELVRLAESHGSEGLLASVLLLDEDGEHLRHGAAPGLPPAYNDAIDGVAIGPAVGACGTAAYRNEPVVSRDIETDPRWRDFKELALANGLRSCWSTPIPSRAGSVLGTFALYYPEPMDPPAVDRQVVGVATRIASIAIGRKREEAQIERLLSSERNARADAESANRAKDEFLALISHELRNPLNAMLGWTRLLRMGNLDEETRRQGIETIERNAELQGELIADVLDFARVSSGQLKLELQPARITEIVEEAVESALPDADSAGVRLDLEASPIEPASCDPGRLHQVVTNLIGNAIKFTPSGGRVTIAVCRVDDHARLTVADTGQGIDPDFLPRVFDPFRQADASLARPHSGLGLGLSVVRQVVELHGGRVSAYSEGEGKGATFVVELPLHAAPAPVKPEARRAADVTGLRVLVVDDEVDARELLGTILRHRGAEPTLAASAAEASAALDAIATSGPRSGFDVLVSDIAMPGTDGYALMRAVRRRGDGHAAIPAAALTAHARESDRAKAYAAGYDRHLPKPVDPEFLLAVIADLARGAAAGRG